MHSFRLLIGVCFATATVAVAVVVVLSAFTSWWVLFALMGVPPLLVMVGGAAMMAKGGSPAGFCTDMPCASSQRGDIARATPAR